jgi:transcription antitermination factor NusG
MIYIHPPTTLFDYFFPDSLITRLVKTSFKDCAERLTVKKVFARFFVPTEHQKNLKNVEKKKLNEKLTTALVLVGGHMDTLSLNLVEG